MKRHELGAPRREEEGARVVRRFFARLAAQDGAGAGRLAGEGFMWIGRLVAQEDWRGPSFGAYLREQPMKCEGVRALPRQLQAHLPDAPDLYGGALEAEDGVFLVDIKRQGHSVTVGVVVRPSGGRDRIVRVFEPEALAAALAELGAIKEE